MDWVDEPIALHESLARGTVCVPFNQPGAGPVGDELEVQLTPVGGGKS